MSAVHALRSTVDDRLSTPNDDGSQQPCPNNYCDPENNWIYPNPPFMSPWYIPSPDELAYIARKVALENFNEQLVQAGGTPIKGEYWTSMGAFDMEDKLIKFDDHRNNFASAFDGVDIGPFEPGEAAFQASKGSGLTGPTENWTQSELDRWNKFNESWRTWHKSVIQGQANHLANPEGLLYTGTTGATTGIGTGPFTGMTATAPYVGTKVFRQDGRIREGTDQASIKGHMTKAWAMTFPENIDSGDATKGFSMKKLSKAEDVAKVRPIRLVRADGRYPKAGFDKNNPSQRGSFIDKHARLWYIPYVFNPNNVDEPFADPTINRTHFISEVSEGVTGESNIFDRGFKHRDYLATEAVPAYQGLRSNTGAIFGSCTTNSGYCFLTNRYDCQNYYGGKYGGDGSRCPVRDIRSESRPFEPNAPLDDAQRYLKAYLNEGSPSGINNQSGNRSAGSSSYGSSSSGSSRSSGGSMPGSSSSSSSSSGY